MFEADVGCLERVRQIERGWGVSWSAVWHHKSIEAQEKNNNSNKWIIICHSKNNNSNNSSLSGQQMALATQSCGAGGVRTSYFKLVSWSFDPFTGNRAYLVIHWILFDFCALHIYVYILIYMHFRLWQMSKTNKYIKSFNILLANATQSQCQQSDKSMQNKNRNIKLQKPIKYCIINNIQLLHIYTNNLCITVVYCYSALGQY